DVRFAGSFCDRRVTSQQIMITDPGGGSTPFALTTSAAGVTISPMTGVTPASVQISVDPNAFQNQKGTSAATITITSPTGANVPAAIRVLVSMKDPDQRGTVVNIPGKLVDILPDPTRNRFYVLRQDRNQVLVLD